VFTLVAAGTTPERQSGSLHTVITRFMRVIQPPRVGGAKESSGAMDIAPLDCPDKPGNDGWWITSCIPSGSSL
jgi:hypothetical protein